MRQVVFFPDAFDDFVQWQQHDKKLFKKIARLINETQRNPFEGTGKPEPLKHQLSGSWSRRINQKHRLVYQVTDEQVIVLSCKFHYKQS